MTSQHYHHSHHYSTPQSTPNSPADNISTTTKTRHRHSIVATTPRQRRVEYHLTLHRQCTALDPDHTAADRALHPMQIGPFDSIYTAVSANLPIRASTLRTASDPV